MPISLSLDFLLLSTSVLQRSSGNNIDLCPVFSSPFLSSFLTLLVSQIYRNDPSVHTFFDNTFLELPYE